MKPEQHYGKDGAIDEQTNRQTDNESMWAGQKLVKRRLSIGPRETLHYWALGERFDSMSGNKARPVLIMQHGMRDVGRCMLPIAETLADHFYCVMPDLRGHGKSFKPGSYAIQHFLMDLRRLQQSLEVDAVHLFGHSLGGHITCRYAGLYPSEVRSLVVVEGLGPPRWEMPESSELARLGTQLENAIATASYASNPRVLTGVAEAAERLKTNNPRLDDDWAMQLALWGTERLANSEGVMWTFDLRAQEVFLGVSDQRNFDYWRAIEAPTLVVTGELGHNYWKNSFQLDGYSGRYSTDELNEKLDAISTSKYRTKHANIPGAGHQVHYDQPTQLAEVTRVFLTQQH